MAEKMIYNSLRERGYSVEELEKMDYFEMIETYESLSEEDESTEITVSDDDPNKAKQAAKKITSDNPKSKTTILGKDGNPEETLYGKDYQEESVKKIMSSIMNENVVVDVTEDEIYDSLGVEIKSKMDVVNEAMEMQQAQRILSEAKHPEVQQQLDSGNNPYAKIFNNLELVKLVADGGFEAIYNEVKERTGSDSPNLMDVQMLMMRALQVTQLVEQQHKEELEQLTKKLVMEEFNLDEGDITFDLELKQMGQVKKGEMKMEPDFEMPKPDVSDEKIDAEVGKRRIVNAFIQGAARKGQSAHKLVRQELNQIDPRLSDAYGDIMSGNDFMYWALGGDAMKQSGGDESGHAGNVWVEWDDEGHPTIHAQGITFPVLIHEATKGVVEVFSHAGLPEDSDVADYVMAQTDNLESETWDIRMGPMFWEKFREAIDLEYQHILGDIYHDLIKIPAKTFNKLIHDLLSDESSAKENINDIAKGISDEISREEAEEAISQTGGSSDFAGDDDDDEGPDLGLPQQDDSDDPSTWSKSEIEAAIDKALDAGDFEEVGRLSHFI